MINRKIRLTLLLCLILLACLVPAAYADGLNDLQEAIGSYNQTGNPNSFTLNEAINAQGTAITIPSGFTLTLNKNLVCGDLAIEQGGSALVDGGLLTVMGTLTVDGALTLDGVWADVGAISLNNIAAALEASPARISFTGDSGFVLKRNCGDEANAIHPNYGAITGTKRILDRLSTEHARAVALIDCDVTIPEDYNLDAGQGEIVIQSGASLNIQGQLKAKSLTIQQGGSFVIDGGSLKADVSWEEAPVADLVFPAGLTRLESEAFAGGGFRSVFIPAGVTSIAADAFPEGTVLFGAPGSYAETFAGANGFLFAPVG